MERILDIRLSTQYPPNSVAAMHAAYHAGYADIALYAALHCASKWNIHSWILPQHNKTFQRFPILLIPLLQRYSFRRIWIFLNRRFIGLEDDFSKLEQVLHPMTIMPISHDNIPSSNGNISSNKSPILFLPNPSHVLKHWKKRHHILSFGQDTPVAYRLIAHR